MHGALPASRQVDVFGGLQPMYFPVVVSFEPAKWGFRTSYQLPKWWVAAETHPGSVECLAEYGG